MSRIVSVSRESSLQNSSVRYFIFSTLLIAVIAFRVQAATDESAIRLENNNFLLAVDPASGAITSFVIKKIKCDLIGEKRLKANFRICLPLKDYLCNYIEGTEQKPVAIDGSGQTITVQFKGMSSPKENSPLT